MTDPRTADPLESVAVRYRVTGMDCADCTAEIEHAARGITGIDDAKVSIAIQILTLRTVDARAPLSEVEAAVSALGYRIDRLDSREARPDADDLPEDAAHTSPAYRRALWIVVLLNVGYGLIEIVGGFLSDSQALKADALDFLGDGVITGLGLIAIGWGLTWRARSALIQGLFLGVLGVGVLVNAIVRLQAGYQPEAGLMSVFALIALAVNLMAALVLIPHRTGDANVRAVWLFSRNDALGNLAVVVAAGLVTWTDTAWPDFVVALVIAGLFLQSSWSIITDARRDLHDVSTVSQESS